jgi:predicted membrane GTPase involved in stress response
LADWSEKVLEILQAPTADLRELAHLAGGDPKTFYRGISLSDVDTTGQNIEGMAFGFSRKPEGLLIRVLKALKVNNMSNGEKAELKQKLQAHKKEIRAATEVIDEHLKKLAPKKLAPKKPALKKLAPPRARRTKTRRRHISVAAR